MLKSYAFAWCQIIFLFHLCLLHTCNKVKRTCIYAMPFHSSVPLHKLLPLPRKKSSHKWKMRRKTQSLDICFLFKFIFCLKEWPAKETIYSISLRGNNFWNKVSRSLNSVISYRICHGLRRYIFSTNIGGK